MKNFHSTAQHSTAQHSTAQHSTAQHSTVHLIVFFSIKFLSNLNFYPCVKNKFFAFLLTLAMAVGLLSGMTLTAWGDETPAYSGGTGTQTDPYLISTVDDFKTLAQTVNNGTDYSQKYFRQTASLDLNGVNDLSPVGTLANPFAGNYEGDGFTISNATITGMQCSVQGYNMNVAGVFGALVGGGSISNLIITNVTITANGGTGGWDQAYAGGLVAFAEDCTITDCSVSNSTINANGSNIFAGAFVGFAGAENSEKTAFSKCASENNIVNTMDYGGGFIGAIVNDTNSDNAISFADCYSAKNTADAGTNDYGTVGAFLGGSQSGDISLTNCFVYSCDATADGTGSGKGLFTGDITYGTVKATNTYYYDTNNLTVRADSATSKTEEEMKSLASTLGETFSQGSDYPILLHPINIVVSIDSWTYGETAKEPTVTRNSSVAASYTYAVKGNSNFSSTVPTNAGDYTIKASVASTNLHKAGESTANFTIAKADATVATTPTAKTLAYNGQPQELITAGTTNSGTIVYALGDNATTSPANDKYNVAIPTGTDNKIYYVWYKVTGSSNYNDSIAQCIQVTITLESYTISYSGLEGSSGVSGNPTSYTMKSSDITLINPTKTGYTFAKWTSGDTEITSIPQGSSGNRTLKADWTANTYTVKFNGNGGTGSMSDLTLTYDVEQALSDNKFTRTGYTFNGWKDNDGNKTYNGGAAVKNLTTVNGATITLYAQWNVNQYTLTFNTDGGSAISAITQDYGTAVTAPANPTKEGYTFNGWDKEIPSTMPAENLTFTAQWTENEKTPDTDPESDDKKGSTEPESDDKQATEESADKTPESKTANAEAVSTMSNEELKQTFENKTAITLTGNISNENLSSVIEKIASVTEVKTLDLSKLEGVTEVKLKETTAVETLSVAGNQTITKVEVQNNASLKSINLSSSKVETIDAKGCTELTEVILTSCDELQKLDVSETPITKLDTSNCEKLSSINCSSCDISELNIDGCKKLADLNCANNSLSRLDVSGFALNSLECEHQTVKGFIRRASFNILDILLRRLEAFVTSDANDDSGYVANVKDITGVDENGNEFSPISYNEETGEVVFSKAPANIKYNYITGFSDISMDVTVETSGESQQINSLGSSGGGCDMGFAGLGVLALALTFMKKNHSK